jgi:hypothetical protein
MIVTVDSARKQNGHGLGIRPWPRNVYSFAPGNTNATTCIAIAGRLA